MNWLIYVEFFFGGAFVVNAIPHFVAGVLGRPFQSPFAKPPGEGLSSSTVNVLWGWANAVVGYILIVRVHDLDWHANGEVIAFGAGALLMSLMLARHFGKFYGGHLR